MIIPATTSITANTTASYGEYCLEPVHIVFDAAFRVPRIRLIPWKLAPRKSARLGNEARRLMRFIAADDVDWYLVNDTARRQSYVMSPDEAYLFAAMAAASHQLTA